MKPPTAASVHLLIVLLPLAGAVAMAAAATDGPPATYLVFVDPTPPGVTCMKYHLGILSAALGRSEEKAKAAIIYNYKNVINGFSARVTPSELEVIKKQPQVNQVLPSATLHLMSSNFDGVS
nr:subtilisin-like protease SBT3.17 isoform X2 [Lolium perenne]